MPSDGESMNNKVSANQSTDTRALTRRVSPTTFSISQSGYRYARAHAACFPHHFYSRPIRILILCTQPVPPPLVHSYELVADVYDSQLLLEFGKSALHVRYKRGSRKLLGVQQIY